MGFFREIEGFFFLGKWRYFRENPNLGGKPQLHYVGHVWNA